MCKLVALFAAMLVVSSAYIHSNSPVQKCGTALANLIDQVCNSSFNTRLFRKKSLEVYGAEPGAGEEVPYPGSNSLPVDEEDEGADVLFNKRPAFSLMSYRRMRRGIADECCRRPCRVSDIMSYCVRR
uniref:Insulin-like peptide 4 n=1 Tax=Carausius morosus TaxID=7022 RepID=A0A6G4ZW67_CARMO|nr:insulin-like protein 4 [Carausius morosus]